jgi:cytochrome c-L
MRSMHASIGFATAGMLALVLIGEAAADVAFHHALDNSLLEVKPRPNEVVTDAVKEFLANGKNPYDGQEKALADGKKIYVNNCQSCHLPDGTGRIGPSLVGDKWIRERAATDVGMFEIVYGGASGAMQSFARRGMSMDDMLKVIAYVRSLKKT